MSLHELMQYKLMAGASTIAIGAFSQVDSRYVHSDDMDQYKKHVATVIVTQATDSCRKTIEDRLLFGDSTLYGTFVNRSSIRHEFAKGNNGYGNIALVWKD